jgi:hypothetical protein
MKQKHKYVPFEIKTPKTTNTIEILVLWDDEIRDWIMPEQSMLIVEAAKCSQRLKEIEPFAICVGIDENLKDDFFLTFSPSCGPETTIFNLTSRDLRHIRSEINQALKSKAKQ